MTVAPAMINAATCAASDSDLPKYIRSIVMNEQIDSHSFRDVSFLFQSIMCRTSFHIRGFVLIDTIKAVILLCVATNDTAERKPYERISFHLYIMANCLTTHKEPSQTKKPHKKGHPPQSDGCPSRKYNQDRMSVITSSLNNTLDSCRIRRFRFLVIVFSLTWKVSDISKMVKCSK